MKLDASHEMSPLEVRFRRFSKSGRMTPTLIGVLCVTLLTASYLRGRGNVHKLGKAVKTAVIPTEPDLVVTNPGPGGQDPIRLTRSASSIGRDVEFLSATLLPGRGMNVFQITAMIPGHGEVPLMYAPSVDGVAGQLNDQGDDTHGELSMKMGGAFLLPWAGRLSGTPAGTPNLLQASWQGQLLHFPALAADGTTSVDGLFLDAKSTDLKSDVLPDGQYAQAVFKPAFGGQWPSTIQVTSTVELSGHTLDLTLSATNAGISPAPIGMGWHPMFVVPSGNRAETVLKVPSSTVLAMNRTTGLPTGRTVAADGAALEFGRPGGAKLGTEDVDTTYTQLQSGGTQPAVEIRDPSYNILLRVIPMTSNIIDLHVVAPADRKWLSVAPNTNVPDAFGSEWKPEDTGMVMLTPGASIQWKVRIEISALDEADKVR
jgi:galactose mutarotase-like enzyme